MATTAASDAAAAADPQGRSDSSGSAATEGPDQDARGNASGRRASADRRNTRAGDLKSEKSAGTGAAQNDNAGNGATARQIPDGSDDDVVARRLRKAAEQETDPELKDKLWKEYIDYKNNSGSDRQPMACGGDRLCGWRCLPSWPGAWSMRRSRS